MAGLHAMGNVDAQPTLSAKCGRLTRTADGSCPECWAISDLIYGLIRHTGVAVGVGIVVAAALLYFGGLL